MYFYRNLIYIISFCCFYFGVSQENKTKYHLYDIAFYRTKKGLAFSNRTGIDSIHFPVDSTKIRLKITTKNALDLNLENEITHGKTVSQFYYFTPMQTGRYKLPNAVVWSHNRATTISFPDSIYLHFTSEEAIEKAIQDKKKKLKSRLNKKDSTVQLISWTSKKTYETQEEITLVIESNRLLNNYPKPPIIKGLQSGDNTYNSEVNNGKEWSYFKFSYKAFQKGKIKIPSIKQEIEGKKYRTKSIKLLIEK